MKAIDARKLIQHVLAVVEDGEIGPKSLAALNRLIGAPDESKWPPAPVTEPVGPVDARSERAIATLDPKLQPVARLFVHKAIESGITIKVTSGTRTYKEQNALYAQGRTKPGPIVTNAKGGQSSHNFGTAFDVTIFNGSKPVWESPRYRTLGTLGKSLGLSWGGDWTNVDEPHFYLKPEWARNLTESQMMAGLRERHANGVGPYA